VYSREPKPVAIREEEAAEKLVYEARRLHEAEDGVKKEIKREQLVEKLLEEARRLRGCPMIQREANDRQRRPSPLSNAASDFHSASGRSSNTQNVEMQELVDNEPLPSRVPSNRRRSIPGGKRRNRRVSEGDGWQYDHRQYSRRRGPIRNASVGDRILSTRSLDNLYQRSIDPDLLKRSSVEMILAEAALLRERLLEQEYENERWERFSGVTEPILRRTRRVGRRNRSFKESSVGRLPDEVQLPLIPSQASSVGNANENEMEHSPWIRAMQPASSRSEQLGRVCRDEMENSVGTCSTPRMLHHELADVEGNQKRTHEYHQQQSEEREYDETDRLMEDDIVYHQDQKLGELERVRNPRIKIPFIVGDKVIFKVDLSDCEVKKGDCGEVVALMEMGSVVVRTNNLAMEVKVDNIYLEKATIYHVKFVTGLCGFGVVPGRRSKRAYVGPTLQSEHARRTVLSGSQIVKVNNRNVEAGYSSREIKKMIKTSKRPIVITFKWDQERADKMLSQRAPY